MPVPVREPHGLLTVVPVRWGRVVCAGMTIAMLILLVVGFLCLAFLGCIVALVVVLVRRKTRNEELLRLKTHRENPRLQDRV